MLRCNAHSCKAKARLEGMVFDAYGKVGRARLCKKHANHYKMQYRIEIQNDRPPEAT